MAMDSMALLRADPLKLLVFFYLSLFCVIGAM